MNIPHTIIEQSSRLFDTSVPALQLLGGMDGNAYAFQREDGSFVLKIAPFPLTDEGKPAQMEEKFTFVDYLAQHGVRVARPVASVNGKWVEVIQHGERGYLVSAATKAPGKAAGGVRGLTPAQYRKWGQVTGQMHALAKTYPTWRRDGEGDPPTLIDDWYGERRGFAEWCREDDIRECWNRLNDQLAEFPRERECFGLVHNDLHPANFLVHAGEITVIDFDVCCYHWFAIDLAIPLFFAEWGSPPRRNDYRLDFLASFFRSFMKGYNQENHLDPQWIARLPLFLKHHQILLYIVFSDQWQGNPNFKQASQLSRWRRAILEDLPVIELDFQELAHAVC